MSSQKTTGDIVKFSKHIAILGMLASFTCVAQTIKSDGSPDVSPSKLERMPESLEVRYALSAAPPHLRAGATTYVLDPSKGYLLNHRGTNGVSCIVVRVTGSGPTVRSETILRGRFASTPKAQRHCYKTISTRPN